MKKIFFLVLAIFTFYFSNAQTSIETKKENFSLKVYAGVLNSTTFSFEETGVTSSASLRLGGDVSYQLTSKLSLKSFIANNFKDKNLSIASYYLKYNFSDEINLSIGQVATPATLFRPHPVSAEGQFESWSTSQLPGSGLGATISFFNSKFGIYKKGDEFEFHFGGSTKGSEKYGKLKGNMWFSGDMETIGTVFSYKKEKVNTTLSFISKGVDRDEININNLFVYTLNKKGDLYFYSDTGYSVEKDEILRLQLGVLKYLKTEYVDVMIGGAYDYTTNGFNGYLQINL